NRPILYIGVALAALVVLTMILSFFSEPRQNRPVPKASAENKKSSADPMKKNRPGSTGVSSVSSMEYQATVKNKADLADALRHRGAREIKAKIRGKIELDKDGLVFDGPTDQRVTVESSVADNHAWMHFHYQNDSAPFGFTLDGGKEIVFRRCKFQIDSDA